MLKSGSKASRNLCSFECGASRPDLGAAALKLEVLLDRAMP